MSVGPTTEAALRLQAWLDGVQLSNRLGFPTYANPGALKADLRVLLAALRDTGLPASTEDALCELRYVCAELRTRGEAGLADRLNEATETFVAALRSRPSDAALVEALEAVRVAAERYADLELRACGDPCGCGSAECSLVLAIAAARPDAPKGDVPCERCRGEGYLVPTFAIGLVDPLPRHTCRACDGSGASGERADSE